MGGEMEWLSRHKRKLLVLEGMALLCAAAVLVYARSQDSAAFDRAQFGLIALPWVVAFAAALPLIYLSWFGRPPPSPLLLGIKKGFFWLFASAVVSMFVMLYGTFVFGIL